MYRKGGLFSQERAKQYVSHTDSSAANQIQAILTSSLRKAAGRPLVTVCIGTDRSTGDSLGPLVGTKLEKMNLGRLHVYGTLSDPVHAVNMKDKLKDIQHLHKNPFIIAVDACLGRVKSVGSFQIGDGPLKPGAGVQKDLPEIGDVHINGIVNVSGFMEYFVLQNTRLHLVMSMANVLAEGLQLTDKSEGRQERLSPFHKLTRRI
ncbi:spore protease YyaC [Bacillus velezensis]|uniref:spore protease YyaC n=1 Tax=Bacillus velezensis TaxID=492670 RepID=UPI001687E928|nr:spore protease YyaC [Bacillus velezensis]MEA1007723.1 spore protease YyaC [Bacillus velezensis]QNV53018.1 hypothetical protein GE573_01947 [Bacillus velezensis]